MKELYLVIVLLLLCCVTETYAQRSNGLTLEGVVSVEQGSVEGAVIQMFRNGKPAGDLGIGSNGRYRVELNYNNEFILIYTRKDNFPQKIVVDTHVPQEVLQSDPLFPPFPVNIKLFTEIPGIDKTFSENTVMKIYYSKSVDNFISDLFYNDVQIKHLIDQAIAQSKQIGREADHLAGLTRSELAELKKEYDRLIKDAENEYNREEFLSALDGYKAANQLFPREQYPKDRIAEINDLLGLVMVAEEMEKALTERLQVLLSRGDLMFDQKKYEDAMSAYQRALSVDAGSNHAQSRLAEIKDILDNIQSDKEYDALIVAADNSFDELLYAEARNIYLKALELKEGETYPRQRIQEIDKILEHQASNAEKLKGYKESVFQAELNYEKQFYDKAITFYENALTFKPGDEVATGKIEEIRALMTQLANQTLYDRRIKAGDKAFKKEQYDEALTEYEEAAKLMPSEQYALSQIQQINALFAEQERLAAEAEAERQRLIEQEKAAEQARLAALEEEKEQRFDNAVLRADSLFALKEYERSRQEYQAALQVKPGDVSAGNRIKEIDDLLVQLAAVQKEYESAVSRGDEAFGNESLDGARAAYNEAAKIKPGENYPKEMLVKIDSIAETRERLAAEAEAERLRLIADAEKAEQERLAAMEAEKEKQYLLAMAQADSLLGLKEYESARTAYQSALEIKPDEEKPGQRISEIDQLIVVQAEAKELYDAAIIRGDEALKQESFELAKAAYGEAQRAMPEATYPDEMLAHVDSVLDSRIRLAAEAEAAERERLAAVEAERDLQYEGAVARADSLFEMEEYQSSLAEYKSALQVKPDEVLPAQKIEEIRGIVEQMAVRQQNYDAAVSRGEDALQQEVFDDARSAFLEAQQSKPDEAYPGEMIARIDSIVEAREQLAAREEAERLRLAAEAEAAEKARLAQLEAEKEERFNQIVQRADSLFDVNDYENALSAYRLALEIKPQETAPGQRITAISELLDKQAAAELAYSAAVERGDEAFSQEAYEDARSAYGEARQAKPEVNYPQVMLAKIDSVVEVRERLAEEAEAERVRLAAEAEAAEKARLAALQAEKEHKLKFAVTRADSLFNMEDFENARLAYQEALKVDAEADYPRQRIVEVDKVLASMETARLEREKLERDYLEAVTMADKLFNGKDYNQAKEHYQKATALKPEEAYPQTRISEAEQLIQQAELDENYQSLILAADGFYQQDSLTAAKAEYEKAIALKPGESYPGSQLTKIDNQIKQLASKAMAEQQAAVDLERRRKDIEKQQQSMLELQEMNDAGLNRLYQEYIALADEYFGNKMYNVSRAWYYKAWDVKQDESYPQQQINEINRIVGGLLLSQRDRDFQNFVNLADSTLRENQLAVSRGWYNRALSVKPNESYPKEQLQVIEVLIAERMAGRSGTQFESHMKNAAEAFENKNYNVARYWYKRALELRPDDQEVKEKLQEISNEVK